jgi:hypothetical protein
MPLNVSKPRFWPTLDVANFICAEIASGKSLNTVCSKERRASGTWMSPVVVLGWMAKADMAANNPDQPQKAVHSDFESLREKYARATRVRLEMDVEQLLEIERRLAHEPQKIADPQQKVGWRPNPDALDPHAARVVVDSIKWRLSKLLPEKYGDRQEIKVGGEVKVTRPSQDAPEWMQERIKEKIGKRVADEPVEAARASGAGKDGTSPSASQQGKDEPTVH